MSTTVRLLAIAILAAVIGPAGQAADHSAVPASSPASDLLEIVVDEPVEQHVALGADAEQRTRLDAGIATFDAARLELPHWS